MTARPDEPGPPRRRPPRRRPAAWLLAVLAAVAAAGTAAPSPARAAAPAAGEAACRVGRAGGAGVDVTAELDAAVRRCRAVLVEPGDFRVRHTIQLPSGVAVRGTLGPDGRRLSRIASTPASLDAEGSHSDAVFLVGTFLTAGNPIPFRPNQSLYGTVRLPLAAFEAGTRTVRLRTADGPAQLQAATGRLRAALGALGPGATAEPPTVFLFSDRYWRHGYNNFRPLLGEVNQIVGVDPGRGTVELARPVSFGAGDVVLGVPDPRRPGWRTFPSGEPIPPHVAARVTVADLELASTGVGRAPLSFLGCFACEFRNLDLKGANIIGGNALSHSRVGGITGAFTNILMDTGYLTNQTVFEDFQGIRYDPSLVPAGAAPGQIAGSQRRRGTHLEEPERAARPLIQHGESSSNNVFRNFRDMTVSGRSFQDLIRLTGIRGVTVADFDLRFLSDGRSEIKRSLINLNDHEPEDFLFARPIDRCFAGGDGGGERGGRAGRISVRAAGGDGPAQPGVQADGRVIKGLRGVGGGSDAAARADVLLLRWLRSGRNPAFLEEITNGSTIEDGEGCRAAVVLALELAIPAGAFPDPLAAKIAAQDEVWREAKAYYAVGESSGARREVLEVVELGDGRLTLLVGFDPGRPEAGGFERGERVRLDLFPDLRATAAAGFVGNDHRQPTTGVVHGPVQVTSADGRGGTSLGVARAAEVKYGAAAAAPASTLPPAAGEAKPRGEGREGRAEARAQARAEARAEDREGGRGGEARAERREGGGAAARAGAGAGGEGGLQALDIRIGPVPN